MNDNHLILPPHSIEAEQAVIGAILIAGATAFDRIEGIVGEIDFYALTHRKIFAAAKSVYDSGHPIDLFSVSAALEARGRDETVGGISSLGEIAKNAPGAANIVFHARAVREKATLRRLQGIANDIHAACSQHGKVNAEEIVAQADAEFVRLLDRSDSEPTMLEDAMDEALRDVDARAQRGGKIAGLETGFADFDSLTGGLEPGQLIIVAARPSVGKTIFACNLADHVARSGRSVLFHTLEMSRKEIGMRLLASKSGVPMHSMRSGTRNESHWQHMTEARAKTSATKLSIDDRGAIGVGYVRAVARRIKRQHGLNMIVIDYLQLMKGQGDNRTQEIGSLSRGLKTLAKELSVPIVALAQLSREVEKRQDKRPVLADLRDSGEIEQDADIVAMLHREELYNKAPEWEGIAELIVRKNRNGPIGNVKLKYDGPLMRFPDCTDWQEPRRTSSASNYPRGFK